jgi:hypothetical protein
MPPMPATHPDLLDQHTANQQPQNDGQEGQQAQQIIRKGRRERPIM